ncbi:MAG: hypothetical protein OXG65_16640 [Chloroflexi bacterium]|nr:hypothetical protein [Chloroflexota bacterium]
MTRGDGIVTRLDRLPVLVALATAALAAALTLRSLEGKTFLYGDLQHFFAFAEVAFTPEHFNYYASVSDQSYTYAHLPLFPMLLAPLQRVFDTQGWDRILAVKVIVHAFEVATAGVLLLLARRQGLSRPLALGIGILWLFTPWVFEAGALNGHASSVAAFFLVAAALRLRIPWQAGGLVGLSVVTRSEFVLPALVLSGYYARRGPKPFAGYAAGGSAIGALIVGPFLIRDAAAVHWAVVGHLQNRGDGLPVFWGFARAFGVEMPDGLRGPRDWPMLVVLASAPLVGWLSHDPRWGMFRMSVAYFFVLMLGHGRYYILPLTAGLMLAARPRVVAWLIPVYVVEFVLPLTRPVLWVVRAAGALVLGLWPLIRRWWRSPAYLATEVKDSREKQDGASGDTERQTGLNGAKRLCGRPPE